MTEPTVELSAVSKAFRGRTVVHSVDLELQPGESVTLTGPNASGKSTLLRLIAGVLEPDRGSVKVLGAEGARARAHVGYLPHDAPAYETLKVSRFLAYMGALRGVPRRQLRSRTEEILELTGCQAVADRTCGTLSRGYRQRACIGATIIHDPDVVLLDEPFTALDVSALEALRTLLRKERPGRTILVASHPHPDAFVVSQRVIRMRDGRFLPSTPTEPAVVTLTVRGDAETLGSVLEELPNVLGVEVVSEDGSEVRRRVILERDSVRTLADALYNRGLQVLELHTDDAK